MPVNFTESAPPKKTAVKRTTPAEKTASPDTIRKDREEAVNGVFQLASVVAMMFGKTADAGAINIHAPGISRETVKLADSHEYIGKGIDALAQVSPYAGLVAVITPLIVQLAANHNKITPMQAVSFGATDPKVLAQRMEVEANRQAIQIQLQMAEEKRRMDEEYASLEREMNAAKERETVPA